MNKQLVLLSLALCLAIASAISLREAQTEFVNFQRKYQRVYDASEFATRFNIFRRNLEIAEESQKANPKAKFGVTKFSDLSPEEFRKYYLMPKNISSTLRRNRLPVKTDFSKKWTSAEHPLGADPTNWDWFQQGACTPVYDQGQCGSCWAFSATGSMEGAWAIKKTALVSLSEQQLVDCSTSQGNEGCNGGLMDYAFEYVIANKGITTETAYPYKAVDGRCNKAVKSAVTISSYKDIKANDDASMQAAVVLGPVAVAIEADQPAFQFYKSGVFADTSCGTSLDHGVLAVGYNTLSNVKYWIVKNSWGSDWGNKGYIWMARKSGAGECGINMESSYPVV